MSRHDDRQKLALEFGATDIVTERGDDGVARIKDLTGGIGADAETFVSRGWTSDEWTAAVERLASRGWIGPDGTATAKGRDGRAVLERRTDELANGPWQALGEDNAARLAELVHPVLEAVLLTGLFPPNTTLGVGKIPNAWA